MACDVLARYGYCVVGGNAARSIPHSPAGEKGQFPTGIGMNAPSLRWLGRGLKCGTMRSPRQGSTAGRTGPRAGAVQTRRLRQPVAGPEEEAAEVISPRRYLYWQSMVFIGAALFIVALATIYLNANSRAAVRVLVGGHQLARALGVSADEFAQRDEVNAPANRRSESGRSDNSSCFRPLRISPVANLSSSVTVSLLCTGSDGVVEAPYSMGRAVEELR